MDHLQWYDYLRMFTGILALFTLYNIAKRFARDKSTYNQRLVELSWAFQGFLLLTFIGMLEQILTNVPFGYRTILSTILILGCFRASLRKEPLVKEGYHG